MKSVPPPGKPANEILCIGESQGYQGLYVHFGIVFDHARERQTTRLTTAYLPTPEQIARIVAGEPIVIELINVQQHPPIMVDVGTPLPEEDRKCECGGTITFYEGDRHARCFNINCGAYLHR